MHTQAMTNKQQQKQWWQQQHQQEILYTSLVFYESKVLSGKGVYGRTRTGAKCVQLFLILLNRINKLVIYIWNWWYIYTYKRLYAIKNFFLLAPPPPKKFVFRREKERGINQLDGENLQIIEYHIHIRLECNRWYTWRIILSNWFVLKNLNSWE